jgi:hypothetical protein
MAEPQEIPKDEDTVVTIEELEDLFVTGVRPQGTSEKRRNGRRAMVRPGRGGPPPADDPL